MRRASVIRLTLLACLWGASFLFIKVALRGLSPVQIVLGRLALGAAVLLVVVAVRREPLPRSRMTWGHLAVAAVVANIIPYFLFGWGEQRIAQPWPGSLTPLPRCLPWCSPLRRVPNPGPLRYVLLACCSGSSAPSWSWRLGELVSAQAPCPDRWPASWQRLPTAWPMCTCAGSLPAVAFRR